MAWFVFNLLAPFAVFAVNAVDASIRGLGVDLTFAPAILIYTSVFAAPWSFGALLLVGAPMAFMLGTGMRRRRYSVAHLGAFTGLGAFVGAAGIVTWQWWIRWPAPGVTIRSLAVRSPWEELDWALTLALALMTAVAVPLGWRFTMRRALLADPREPRGSSELY